MPRGTSRAENVVWRWENEAKFIELCHEEHVKGQLQTTAFSPQTMKEICTRLNAYARDGSFYTPEHCKTKYKRIKKAWKLLHELTTTHGSGLGWDSERNTVTGPPDVLATIYAAHPDNKGIIKHGLPHFEMCTDMFFRSVATGSNARSSMQPPLDSDDDEPPATEEPYILYMSFQSVHDFGPTTSSQDNGTSSRSSGRKRPSGGDRDAVLIRTMENFNDFIVEKRSKTGQAAKDELNSCIGIVKAMDGIHPRLIVKAAKEFKFYANRQVFLSLDDDLKRHWVASLDD